MEIQEFLFVQECRVRVSVKSPPRLGGELTEFRRGNKGRGSDNEVEASCSIMNQEGKELT